MRARISATPWTASPRTRPSQARRHQTTAERHSCNGNGFCGSDAQRVTDPQLHAVGWGVVQQCCRHFRGVSERGSWLVALGDYTTCCTQLLSDRLGVIVTVDVHRGGRTRFELADACSSGSARTSSSSMRCRLPIRSAGSRRSLIRRTTVGRLTPRRSAASWAVSFVVCGTPIPHYDHRLFIEFEWDSTRIGELSSGTPERSNCLWDWE